MENTKERIAATALELWVQRGYDGVSVKEICEGSGITKPTLYHHFTSKLGLLEAIVNQHWASLRKRVSPQLLDPQNTVASLTSYASAWFHSVAAAPDFARLFSILTWAPSSHPASIVAQGKMDQLVAELEQFFVDSVVHHGNFAGRAPQYASSWLAMVQGYGKLVIENPELLDQEAIFKLVHQYCHGIFS